MLKNIFKRPIRRVVIAVIAAVAVLIAAVSPIQLLGAVIKGEPLQTPEKVYLGAVNASKNEKALSTYYTVNTDEGIASYTRTSTGAVSGALNWQKGVPVIYGNTYTTFTIEFDYQFTAGKTGKQQIWVVMGVAEKTAFSTANGAAAVAIGIGGYSAATTCNINAIDKSNTNKSVASSANFDGTAKHHAKITMDSGVLNFIIDGVITATHTVSNYNGGYIGIGTGQKGTLLSDVRVSDTVIPEPEEEIPPKEGMDTENIYFGKPTGDRVQDDPAKYYGITQNGGVTQYVRNKTAVSTANNMWQCDTPFISLGEYKNFILEFDYQYTGTGERYIWINVGNSQKTVFNMDTGSAYFGLGVKNAASQETYVNGIYGDADKSGWFDNNSVGWLDTNGKGSVLDGTAKHHVKITVKDKVITVDIDNGVCLKRKMITRYNGGFVMVGTNYADTLLSGFSVMDIDNVGNYSFYKTDDILSGAQTTVGMSDYYKISGTAFTRNGKDKGSETDNVALFSDNVYYTDFDSSFKVAFPDGVGTSYSYMMMGALTSYQSYNDLTETGVQLLTIRQTVTDSGKTLAIRLNGGGWSEEFTPETALSEPYDLTFKINGSALTVNMGETELLKSELSSKYAGGMVSVGTPNEGVTFSSIKIESTANFDGVFDSYFASELATEACGGRLEKADFKDYWYTEGGMVVRNGKSTADNHTKNMAVLYIDPNKYNNFEVSLRYKTVADRGAYVGFGAEKGKSWWAHTKNPEERAWEMDKGNNIVYLIRSGAVEAGPIKTYIEGSNESTWWYDTWMTQSGTLFSTTEENESYHTLKIRVENGMMTVWINDNSQGTITLAEYKEGYIYFAASMSGVSFTVPRITDFDNEPEYDFSQYTSYYTKDVKDDMKKVDANDYWRINSDGNLERKTVMANDTRDLYEMAYLKVNDTDYSNFTLELDYKHGTSGWGRFFIGFGATEDGKTWHQANGGISLTIMTEGVVEYNGNFGADGGHASTIFWAIMDDDGTKHQVVPNYKRSAWHHLYMEVAAGICTVRIDDYNWDYELVLPADFDPRNIFIASNSSAAQIRQISITDTSALFPPDTSTGWEPTDEDIYFDFSRRTKNYIPIHEYLPSKKIK